MEAMKLLPLTSRLGVALLVVVHVLYRLVPAVCPWICLIPGHALSGAVWTLLTSAFLERSPVGLLVSCAALSLYGHIFEPRWGQREVLRFAVVCVVASGIGSCAFVTAAYAATRSETILFVELSGCSGIVAGIAVAIQQAAAQNSLGLSTASSPVGWLVGESRKVAMLYLGGHTVWCLLSGHTVDILLAVNGLTAGWIYLRFYQPHSSALAREAFGDTSEAFAFASMFFARLQPAVDGFSQAIWMVVQAIVPPSLSQHSGSSSDLNAGSADQQANGYLPGSNPNLAEQRRARALQTLEERLAASPGPAPKSEAPPTSSTPSNQRIADTV
ncbi:eukaryotic integral membrane protein-domain-containing protein [Pavlovales sp. CCMP2436]|nr:eukaryotic integral membrane protein-domain-containing protein [Pavlovales sp. CCMP2436]